MSVDSRGALELVRAGLISYRQLNEIHKLIKETGGGDLRSALLDGGYVTEEQLAGRRRRPNTRKRLKLTYSLDLVKAGLLTFKQLNLCHREARESKGKRTILDIAVEKEFVSELQVATLPEQAGFAAQDKHNKRFSSSWDLFRGGLVSLRALNECHRTIKLDSPNKSLKEALIERGYVTAEQVAEFDVNKSVASVEPEASAFMEKYADEFAKIPADLRERLRSEHLKSRGLEDPELAGVEPGRRKRKKKKKKKKKPAAEVVAVPVPAPADEDEDEDEDEDDGDGTIVLQSYQVILEEDDELI
ncbi:MAG: hypothetical protein JKY65_13200 [Planctomycetes bacterium]|nr:hypothetical protein [Planctomycetota bacterium]